MQTVIQSRGQRLLRIAQELAEVAREAIEDEGAEGIAPEIVQSVQERMGRRECLFCGRLVPEDEAYYLGQGAGCCYFRVRRKLRDGRLNLADLILEGRICSTPSKGGRKERESPMPNSASKQSGDAGDAKNNKIREVVQELKDLHDNETAGPEQSAEAKPPKRKSRRVVKKTRKRGKDNGKES